MSIETNSVKDRHRLPDSFPPGDYSSLSGQARTISADRIRRSKGLFYLFSLQGQIFHVFQHFLWYYLKLDPLFNHLTL
jgi:hypothetical protein